MKPRKAKVLEWSGIPNNNKSLRATYGSHTYTITREVIPDMGIDRYWAFRDDVVIHIYNTLAGAKSRCARIVTGTSEIGVDGRSNNG